MIEMVRLENFKGFSDTGKIKFEHINLLYGPNSSGKSSIIHSLVMLKQSLESKHTSHALTFRGTHADLGSYYDAVFFHDIKKSIKIQMEIKGPFGYRAIKCEKIYYKFEVAFNAKENLTFLKSLSIGFDNPKYSIKLKSKQTDNCSIESEELMIEQKDYRKFTNMELENVDFHLLDDIIDIHHAKDELAYTIEYSLGKIINLVASNAKETNQSLNEDIFSLHKSGEYTIDKRINIMENYLSKVESILLNKENVELDENNMQFVLKHIERAKRQVNACKDFEELRKYYLDTMQKEIFQFNGLFYNNFELNDVYRVRDLINVALYHFENEFQSLAYIGPLRNKPVRYSEVNPLKNSDLGASGEYMNSLLSNRPDIIPLVNEALKLFELKYTIDPISSENGNLVKVVIKHENGVETSLLDVGFGISQLLPLIVQALAVTNSTILIEQPEVHLHPKLQTQFCTFMVKNTLKNNNQFIIETHSEHLLLRIQRILRNKDEQINNENVRVFYVDNSISGACAKNLLLDEQGHMIDKWPDGFFDEDYNEVFA